MHVGTTAGPYLDERARSAVTPENAAPGWKLIVVLCGLVAMLDGFDTQAIALAAPDISHQWSIAMTSFGPIFGAGLLGGLIGAILLGNLADRIGRKPTLLLAVALFGSVTCSTILANGFGQLVLLRLVTGLGLGGALPCMIALAAESAPGRLRTTVVATMFCGFPFGAILAGVAAAVLIPIYGWRSLFVVGGIPPLLLLVLLARFLPRSRSGPTVSAAPAISPRVPAPNRRSAPGVARLFSDGLAARTLLLWSAFFCSLLLSYFLVNWIPLLAGQSGVDPRAAVLGVAALNAGGVMGCITIGLLADRFGRTRIISVAFLAGAIAVALIGRGGSSSVWLLSLAAIAGFFSIGAQMATVAVGATLYDTAVRGTGVGWSMGVGRVGALIGPVIGGVLLSAGISAPLLFLCAGAVSALAATAVFSLGRAGASS